MVVSKIIDHIQVNIKMPNPSLEPPAPTKAQNQDLKDMDILFTFKIRIEGPNLENGWVKDQWPYTNQDKDVKPQSEATGSSEAQTQYLKDIDIGEFVFWKWVCLKSRLV